MSIPLPKTSHLECDGFVLVRIPQLDHAKSILNANLDEIAAREDLAPVTTLLDRRVEELKALRDMREKQLK